MGKRARTDTSRLDWLVRYPCSIIYRGPQGYELLDKDGRLVRVRGLRRAIDACMDAEAKAGRAR